MGWTFYDANGNRMQIAGDHTLASHLGTLAVTAGGTGATSLNNLIALTTHTTGNYVSSLANATNGGTTITNGATEGGAATIKISLDDLATGTIETGDAVVFNDDNGSDVAKKITIDSFFETGPKLVTEDAVAVATDYFLFLDGGATGDVNKESIADFATALAGSGITATNGVLSAAAGVGLGMVIALGG